MGSSWKRVRIGLAMLWLAACGTDDASAPLVATSDASTSPGATTGATATSSGTTTESPTTDDATSLSSSPTSEASASDSTSATDDGSLPPRLPCDLATIDPLADQDAVIDAGDGAGQIPTVIGAALLRHCGCHYTDNVVGYTDYASDVTPLSTHADFHAPFWGTFLTSLHGEPVYLAVEQRVSFQNPLPMPSIECAAEGEPGTITAVDRALFLEWFAAGAPDGASFP